jgi:putative glutathione S-transferase
MPGFGETVDFDQIQAHYYVCQDELNPSQIVPKGPDRSVWLTPHGRETLGGKPIEPF